jgi:hypothetical protein
MEADQSSKSVAIGYWSSSVPVGLPVLASVVVLALVLMVTNGLLIAKNRGLRRRLETVLMNGFAPVGATLPELLGRRVDGTPLDIDQSQSAPLVLLLFEPSCAICDQNWPNWAKLINDPQIGHQCLLLSANAKIPESYLESHNAGRHAALIGISPEIVRSFHLSATPQTILVEKGKVVKTWPSVLSEADLREIKTGLMDLNGANY